MVDLGILADKLGYHSVWIPDHLVDLPPSGDRVDPWVLLGAIGANTNKIKLFTGVTDPIRIHPAKIASIVATLDDLTNGRAELAIGAGERMNLARYGLPWEVDPNERRERLRESILVIRGLLQQLTENTFSFHGKYYNLENARIDQRPVHRQGIYIGALGGRKTLELIGEVGDGWFPAMNSAETFNKASAIIDASARQNKRDPKGIDKVFLAFTILANEDKEKERKCLDALKYSLFTLLSRPVMKEMAKRGLLSTSDEERYTALSYQHMDPTEEGVKKAFSIAKKIPDDIVEKYVLIAKDAPEVQEKLASIAKKIETRHVVLYDVYSLSVSGKGEDCASFIREIYPEKKMGDRFKSD